jgi:hypothetical protein
MILPKAQSTFYIAAQDQRGHSERIQFRVPPDFLRLVEEIMVHREQFGWTTQADMLRWCLWHGIEALQKEVKDSRINSVFAVMEMGIRAGQFDHDMSQFQSQFDKIEKSVSAMQQMEMPDKVYETLETTQRGISAIPDEQWRAKWQAQFDKKFGHLLK